MKITLIILLIGLFISTILASQIEVDNDNSSISATSSELESEDDSINPDFDNEDVEMEIVTEYGDIDGIKYVKSISKRLLVKKRHIQNNYLLPAAVLAGSLAITSQLAKLIDLHNPIKSAASNLIYFILANPLSETINEACCAFQQTILPDFDISLVLSLCIDNKIKDYKFNILFVLLLTSIMMKIGQIMKQSQGLKIWWVSNWLIK